MKIRLPQRRNQICLSLLVLMGCVLWPVNNFLCRFLIVASAVYLLAVFCLAWRKLYNAHARVANAIAAFLVATILAFCAYLSSNGGIDDTTAYGLRTIYVNELRRYEGTRYIWGGENILGIDCSGLPRKALRNALLKGAFIYGEKRCLRLAFQNWWLDASAAALANGYQNYVTWLEKEGTVSDIRANALSPGDLAITKDGVHVMVFLGEDRWISADPIQGKVIIESSAANNPWFEEKVKFYTWTVLLPYNNL